MEILETKISFHIQHEGLNKIKFVKKKLPRRLSDTIENRCWMELNERDFTKKDFIIIIIQW